MAHKFDYEVQVQRFDAVDFHWFVQLGHVFDENLAYLGEFADIVARHPQATLLLAPLSWPRALGLVDHDAAVAKLYARLRDEQWDEEAERNREHFRAGVLFPVSTPQPWGSEYHVSLPQGVDLDALEASNVNPQVGYLSRADLRRLAFRMAAERKADARRTRRGARP